MSSFNRKLLTAAVAMAVVAVVEAAEPKSMFRDGPSLSDVEIPSIAERRANMLNNGQKPLKGNQAMSIEKLPDGRSVISGEVHRGGVRAQIVVPHIQPNVRMTGPAGVDENGRPITWREREDRERANAIVFHGLKMQGYTYESHKKSVEGKKTQLDVWKEKGEETERFVKEHGPITSKEFVVPGLSPEVSARLDAADVGVRMENGKRVYYDGNGRCIDTTPVKKQEAAVEVRPISRTKTSVRLSKRKQLRSAEVDSTGNSVKEQWIQKQKAAAKHNSLDEMDKPAVDAMLKEAPKQAFETDPRNDPRKPIPINLKPESLPDADEVRDRVLEMFPDMGKLKSVSENTVGKRIDRAVSFLLGVSETRASDAQEVATGNDEADEAALSTSAARAIKEGGKFADIVNEIELNANEAGAGMGYNEIIRDIRSGHDQILNAVTGRASSLNTEDESTGVPEYIGSVREAGTHFDPAEFAAEVVNRTTKSLTPEQFNDDVQAIVNSLSEDRLNGQGSSVLNALADILDANPEIYAVIPDADKKLQKLRGDLFEIAPPNPLGEQTYIFVSYSLSEEVLKDIMLRHGNRSDVTIVMRGVPDGMNVPDGVKKMQLLATSVTPAASLIIDPPLFDEYDIQQVPAVVRVGRTPSKLDMNLKDPNGRRYAPMVAKVTGLHNDEWLLDQIENGERGDLGVRGDVKEIAEPNLIDEMKRRVALIDWQKKKEEALQRFWKNQKFKVYQTADVERLREIDPTILVERDLLDLAGRPIRKAGDRVNPLQIRPFTQTMLIFNPLSEKEMARVEAFRNSHEASGKIGLVLIATQMDGEASWDGYKALTDRLDSHVFMMTPDIEFQWHIEKTPVVVTADNARHVFLVRELGPVDGEPAEVE